MRLDGKVAVITGGAKGIGRSIALAYAREGAEVILAGRTESALREVTSEIKAMGKTSHAVVTDLSEPDQPLKLIDRALQYHGKIDILVNDAGIGGPTADVVDMELAAWDEVLAINLTGAMLCAKYALKKSMIPRRNGSIINVSSELGRKGIASRSPYIVSKWGIIGLTQGLAWEVGKHNIRVNCIAPGPTQGERMDRVFKEQSRITGIPIEDLIKDTTSRSPLSRMVKPEEIAELAVFLASDESGGITGQTINCNVGILMT